MLNRWWSVSETCVELDTSLSFGVEDVEQCCATSLLVPHLRRLRPCGLACGYAWSSTFGAFYDMTMCRVCNRSTVDFGRGFIRLSPRSRLHYVCRQREVIDVATARAVVHALPPNDVNI